MCNNGLSRIHIEPATGVLYAQAAPQNYSELIEFGSLTGLTPPAWTVHMGHAQAVG